MSTIHWTTHLIQIAAAFVASFCYAVLYHVPKKALVPVGIVGTGAWMTQIVVTAFGGGPIISAFVGALFVAAASESLARYLRSPVTVFLVGGFTPLVPGSSAYAAMRLFVTGDYLGGLQKGTETFLIAASISIGLVLAGTIARLDRRLRYDRKVKERHS